MLQSLRSSESRVPAVNSRPRRGPSKRLMGTKQLGATEIQITPIGLGAWAIGGSGWTYACGPQDDRDSVAAIHRALDLGVNWIDTAPVYGRGHSEEVIARALRGRRERPYVFTKCSFPWDESGTVVNRLRGDSVRREVEGSLRRLETEAIDLCQIHWPIPEEGIEEGWATLAALKAEGKVRAIGVSNFDADQMRRAQAIAPIESLQPPYSLLDRRIEDDILPFCERERIGVIVYSPMASGLLTGEMTSERIANLPEDDSRRNDKQFQEPRLSGNLALVERLRAIGARSGRSPGEVAVAWTLRHPAVTGAIVGFRRPEQVDGIIGTGRVSPHDRELEELEALLACSRWGKPWVR